ncbi:sporulation integral membrane protein YlbJ [Alteribacter keqinensis]|uniref:Sporulation integral membrane protein YlbJ n=1 Tax=Alteribacter keqinensis TaxID=2483800 RepID=A0A3M7TVS6_9BACI|nr:sporulation integral membrane protein YlbJ [Alteribacter keqinensis]
MILPERRPDLLTASSFKTMVLGGTATFLAVSFILFPKDAYEASIRGLNMWWEVVFPSLLPFFIMSEFLISFGVVTFVGALFEPVMRPLFRVPGVGGFVWSMGMASGFPAGAKLTARLRKDKKITRIQAERLVSFSNASNPIFIFGAIAVGFFHNPALGFLLAVCHYGGNLFVGLAMRFYGTDEEKESKQTTPRFSLRHAFRLMHQERRKDTRPLGKMMGDAVSSAVTTLLMIGGFIILFSVLNRLLTVMHVSEMLAILITIILTILHIPNELSPALISGLFEITLGSQMASVAAGTSLYHQVLITSFILGFNGFSVQAQVASILAETDIRFKPFFFARVLHGFLAMVLAAFLFEPLYPNGTGRTATEVFAPVNTEHVNTFFISVYEWLTHFGGLVTLGGLLLFVLLKAGRALKETKSIM